MNPWGAPEAAVAWYATARARVVADVLAGLRRTEGDVPAALDDDTAFPVVRQFTPTPSFLSLSRGESGGI